MPSFWQQTFGFRAFWHHKILAPQHFCNSTTFCHPEILPLRHCGTTTKCHPKFSIYQTATGYNLPAEGHIWLHRTLLKLMYQNVCCQNVVCQNVENRVVGESHHPHHPRCQNATFKPTFFSKTFKSRFQSHSRRPERSVRSRA